MDGTLLQREVRKLAAALLRHTGQEEGEAQRHLWGRLGILLQRGQTLVEVNPNILVQDVERMYFV